MILNCPKCNHAPITEDLDMETGIIKCGQCQEEYHIEGKDLNTENLSHKHIPNPPKRLKVERQAGYLELSFSEGKSFGGVIAIVIIPIIFGFVYFNFFGANTSQLSFGENTNYVFIGLTLFALFWLYSWVQLVVGFVNETYINVSHQKMEIGKRPIKIFSKTKSFRASNIEQLYVRSYKIHHKDENSSHTKTYFSLDLKLKSQPGAVNLLKNITSPEFAFYIEKEIERYLGIEDRLEIGEYHPARTFKPGFRKMMKIGKQLWKNRKME